MKKNKLLFAGLMSCSLVAIADSGTPLTTSIGLQYRNMNVSGPATSYKGDALTSVLSLGRKVIDDDTYAALGLSYGRTRAWSGDHDVQSDIDSGSANLALMRYIGGGRAIRASLGYGRSALDNITRGISYDADSDSLALGLGVNQFFFLSKTLSGNVGLSYSGSRSRRASYVDSTGNPVGSERFYQSAFSVSSGLSWRLGAWQPNVGISWNHGVKAISLAENDRDSFVYSTGLGYAVSKTINLGLSVSGTVGLKNVRDRSVGLTVSFPL